jgi:hypothetical protein
VVDYQPAWLSSTLPPDPFNSVRPNSAGGCLHAAEGLLLKQSCGDVTDGPGVVEPSADGAVGLHILSREWRAVEEPDAKQGAVYENAKPLTEETLFDKGVGTDWAGGGLAILGVANLKVGAGFGMATPVAGSALDQGEGPLPDGRGGEAAGGSELEQGSVFQMGQLLATPADRAGALMLGERDGTAVVGLESDLGNVCEAGHLAAVEIPSDHAVGQERGFKGNEGVEEEGSLTEPKGEDQPSKVFPQEAVSQEDVVGKLVREVMKRVVSGHYCPLASLS